MRGFGILTVNHCRASLAALLKPVLACTQVSQGRLRQGRLEPAPGPTHQPPNCGRSVTYYPLVHHPSHSAPALTLHCTLHQHSLCTASQSASALSLHQHSFFVTTHDASPLIGHHHSLCTQYSLRQSAISAPLCGLTAFPVLLPPVCTQDVMPCMLRVTLTIRMEDAWRECFLLVLSPDAAIC